MTKSSLLDRSAYQDLKQDTRLVTFLSRDMLLNIVEVSSQNLGSSTSIFLFSSYNSLQQVFILGRRNDSTILHCILSQLYKYRSVEHSP